uniref:Spindle assembly abnormal protein 6 homolog n=1 Tax=Pygocentrus nattereri TaxID=42514 RepID=A0A3B4BVE3_PYGNA
MNTYLLNIRFGPIWKSQEVQKLFCKMSDLVVRLTDDADLYFLYNLVISEEDFQSLKVQQGLLIDFTSFPQKFIDLLDQCIAEQDKDHPRFLLQLSSTSSALDHSPASLNVVETNAFKHLTHLSLKLLPGSDVEVKKYLAACLATVKQEKEQLQQRLRTTEEDLSRQLSYAQQTLSEKSRELDKLRSEWTSQTTSLSSRHTQDLTAEREKALEIQTKLQQQNDQLRRELEAAHQRSTQQLQVRLSELETSNRELTEKKYKSDSTIRDLKAKVLGLEEESQRAKQQVISLRRENGTLDSECHDKERLINQLQTRVAVLEQEIKDKDQLVLRTKEVLEATQQQKNSVEETSESKQLQIGKLEATVKSLSEELIKANGIIKKLQGDLKALVGKIKVKNTVTVSQEKILQETTERLQREQRELQETQQKLRLKEEEVSKLKEQLEATVQKLDESREVLKTNENVITWLNKQLNENQLSRKQEAVGMFETPQAAAGLRLGTHNMPYPVTSTLNSKHSFPLSSLNTGPRSVLTLHNQSAGTKAGFQTFYLFICSHKPITHPLIAENGEPLGLDSKYFERRDDSIPLRGLVPSMHLNKGK